MQHLRHAIGATVGQQRLCPRSAAAPAIRRSVAGQHIVNAVGPDRLPPPTPWVPLPATSRPYNRPIAVAAAPSANGQQPAAPRYKVYRISGDGSCMFRAIAQGLQVATHGTPMSIKSESTAALNLRQSCVRELQQRREELEPFLPGIIEGALNFEQYLKNMSHPMAWGGEPEMMMATYVIKRPITVFQLTPQGLEPIVTYGENLLAAGFTPVSLLWSGAHYDLLVPVMGEEQ